MKAIWEGEQDLGARSRRSKRTKAGAGGPGETQPPSVTVVAARRLSATQRAHKAAPALQLPLLARLVHQPAPGVAHGGQLRGAVPVAARGAGRGQLLPVGGASLAHARAVAEQRVRVRERGA